MRQFTYSFFFVQLFALWLGLAFSVLWLPWPAFFSVFLGLVSAIVVEQLALFFLVRGTLNVPQAFLSRFKLSWVVKILLTIILFSVIVHLVFLEPVAYFLAFFLGKVCLLAYVNH